MRYTKNMSFIKRKLSEELNVGVSRIRFNQESLNLIYDKNKKLNEIVKNLIDDKKLLRIIPKKQRLYKIVLSEKKKVDPELLKRIESNLKPNQHIIYKKYTSLKYLLDRKIVTKKDLWVKKVRECRKLLKLHKKLLGINYSILRKKVKSDKYPSVRELIKEVNRIILK